MLVSSEPEHFPLRAGASKAAVLVADEQETDEEEAAYERRERVAHTGAPRRVPATLPHAAP